MVWFQWVFGMEFFWVSPSHVISFTWAAWVWSHWGAYGCAQFPFIPKEILMLQQLTYVWKLSSILKHLHVSIISLRGGHLPFSHIYMLWWLIYLLESRFLYLLWATTHILVQIHLQMVFPHVVHMVEWTDDQQKFQYMRFFFCVCYNLPFSPPLRDF